MYTISIPLLSSVHFTLLIFHLFCYINLLQEYMSVLSFNTMQDANQLKFISKLHYQLFWKFSELLYCNFFYFHIIREFLNSRVGICVYDLLRLYTGKNFEFERE